MKHFYIISATLLCLVTTALNAKNTMPSAKNKQVEITRSGFYENKGQITDQNYLPNPGVKYLLSSPGFNVQLRQTSFSYDTYTDSVVTALPSFTGQPSHTADGHEQPENSIRRFHRVDVELVGCNTGAKFITEGRSDAYYNYFTAGAANGGASEVHYYSKIIYQDIYPNIDLEFMTSEGSKPVEYNFIVHAGGHPADIKLEYKGANKTTLVDNSLVISVTAGDFTESIPSSYFRDTKQPVNINYAALGNNIYGFSFRDLKLSTLISSSDLIIDPTPNLAWGTYYGGAGPDIGTGIALDASGNVYITGNTHSSSQIATAGAYQTTWGGFGDPDVFVAKFNAAGSALLWGTYYGGTGVDYGTGIALDASGNVYICGNTASTSGIATAGAYQTTNGGSEAFVAKFNSTGAALLWGTYYGGGGNDDATGIVLDASGNVYITGTTGSTSGIATAGAYQTIRPTLGYDAFVAKFNSTGSTLLFGTYYGATNILEYADTYSYGIALDASGDVYITGSTTDTTGIPTAGAYQATYAGGWDAFIAKFNSTGSTLLWGTYYGGGGTDQGSGITLDAAGNVYITGYTSSGSGISTAGAHQATLKNLGNDAFVAKFNPSGTTLLLGSYYGGSFDGGSANTYGYGIALDAADNIYITGSTTGDSGIATAGAYQVALLGTQNAFVAKLNASGSSLLWGTFYGEGNSDKGSGIALDASRNVYVTGNTVATTGAATAGAYQTVNGASAGNPEAFVAKFDTTIVSSGINNIVASAVLINTYPDPTTGYFMVSGLTPGQTIEIYNYTGQRIASRIADNTTIDFNIAAYASGMYLVRVQNTDGTVAGQKKVVKTE